MQVTNHPLVSVIVPTRNSSRTLSICLGSVKRQTHDNIEMIVVDRESEDDTPAIAEQYGAQLIRAEGQSIERSYQRNLGALRSRGEYLIFLDSDIELTEEVVRECVELAEEGFSVITFPEEISGHGFWAECRKLEAKMYLGSDIVEAPRFYARDVFEKLGGFDENITGAEDWDLRERAIAEGIRIGRIGALTIHHEGRVNFFRRVGKKYYYAEDMWRYIRKHRRSAIMQVPLFRGCYYKHLRLCARDPIHTAGFILLKTAETFATSAGIAVALIRMTFSSRKSGEK